MSGIASKKNTIGSETQNTLYFVGPLNLDRQTKQATTVMGTELPLTADEFDALDILAAREDESMPFELLYSAVWDVGDNSFEREAARLRLDNLLRQVGEAGEGFMWIEYDPERGYTFKTHWGHNWQARKHEMPAPQPETLSPSRAGLPYTLPVRDSPGPGGTADSKELDRLLKRIRELTSAEMIVLRHTIAGNEYRVTASLMFVTVRTVRSHISHILPKLDVSSKNELMVYAELIKKSC